jgi:predicted esterase
MGGIGAWRLGILKLDYFRGLIILSSPMRPQVLSQIDKIRYQNIFIIHGAKDLQAPVDDSRQAVEKLTAMQANFEYIELPEAGHALEHAPWTELMVWIKKYSD